MLKVFCNLYRVDESEYTLIKFNNCNVYKFSDYQLFGYNNLKNRTYNVDKIVSYFNNVIECDLNSPFFYEMHNRIKYIFDLSQYKYIAFVDELVDDKYSQNFYNVLPIVFGTIIHYGSDPTTIFSSIWELFGFQLVKPQDNHYIDQANFKAIGEALHCFKIENLPNNGKRTGVIVKRDENCYVIEPLFLKYLIERNDVFKLEPLRSDIINSDSESILEEATAQIYNDYRENYLKLFLIDFVQIFAKLNLGTCKFRSGNQPITDQSDSFILNYIYNVHTFKKSQLSNICKQMGGVLNNMSLKEFIYATADTCHGKEMEDDLAKLSTELLTFNCKVLGEITTSLGPELNDYFEKIDI